MQSCFGGLELYRQFIIYKAVPNGPKTDKFPIDHRTGRRADAHDPNIWLSCDEALAAAAAAPGHGVGFVFTGADPFFFFDLDDALEQGQWSALAQQMCGYFAGCYVEVSVSGTGIHIIGSAALPVHRCKNTPAKLELYHTDRFCALTGTHAQGSALHVAQEQAEWLAANYFPPRADTVAEEWTTEPCAEWSGPTNDEELIAKMLSARGSIAAMFGARATMRELWEADPALANYFPPIKPTDPYDRSDADMALLQHLAFWTGRDCERMDRLYRLSALYRDKWERQDYRLNSVKLAVGRCTGVYGSGRQEQGPPVVEPPTPVQPAPVLGAPEAPAAAVTAPADTEAAIRSGTQYLGITQQIEHFTGCVYIQESHRIWCPRSGKLLKPDQYRATYGGYVFCLDLVNDKVTRNAWEAFTESQAFHFPKAHEICFRPECPPGTMIKEEGYTLLNTYVPVDTRREAGDAAPFLDLIARLLPDERDRTILLSYMAAMVQNPGAKFQWWPVIQGCEGNGKSAIIRALNHCIGNRYSHLPNADAMARTGNQFNGWVQGKLFMGIEEIYVPQRRDFLEAFKTTVTNDRLQIEGKGTNQVMGDNRCNGIMCTNHRDGVPVTVDTRRYCIFYTAQQSKEDKVRDGMTGGYFPNLYQWLKGEGNYAPLGRNYGYAVINDYLHRYVVPLEYNPAPYGMCQEAPATSSTAEAIRASRGTVEQEVIEALEEGRPGFAGGWISSKAFDNLLEIRHLATKVPPSRRRAMLQSLGYDYHPALGGDGRVNNTIPDPAGPGKPRLYIKRGHIHWNLQSASEVGRCYIESQSRATVAAAAFGAAQEVRG